MNDFQQWVLEYLRAHSTCETAGPEMEYGYNADGECTSGSYAILYMYTGDGHPIAACNFHAKQYVDDGDYGYIYS